MPARTGRRGPRGPLRGFPPLPGQPNPVYPPGQFSAWNRPSTRAAWLGIARPAGVAADAEDEPGYSLLAVSDPSADATSTQTWAVIDDDHPAGGWRAAPTARDRGPQPGSAWPPPPGTDRAFQPRTDPGGPPGMASSPGSDWAAPPGSDWARPPGSDWAAAPATGWASRPGSERSSRSGDDWDVGAGNAWAVPPSSDRLSRRPDTGAAPGRNGRLAGGGTQHSGAIADPRTAGAGADGALDTRHETALSRVPPGQPPSRVAGELPAGERGRTGGSRSSPAGRRAGRSSKRHNAMIVGMLLIPVLIVALVVAGYVYFNIKRSSSVARAAPSNTAVAPSSPAVPPGQWKYIQNRATDPVLLSLPEIFPRRFATGGLSGARTVDRAGTKCARAVIGSALTAAVRKAGCTQVLRASYLLGGRNMMATIGVLNLVNVKAAERAGRATGARQFIRQLPAAHGPTHNLTKGTGLEEAQVKGHYLILIWSEFTNLRAPAGAKQRARLETFSNALINGTVNRSLTTRMVTGQPQAT